MEKVDVIQPFKTVLDGTNYVSWAQEMSSFLKGRRLWRYCTGDITKPIQQENEDNNSYIEKLELWDSRNHQILTWIRNTFISSIKLQFGRFETAKEVWDLLSLRYSITDIAHLYRLNDFLRNMKQSKGQSINDFLAQMHSIWDQLALSEPQFENAADIVKFCTYRDNLRLMQFIMSLHDDYEFVRGSLLHREKFPTLESAIAELLSEETRLRILKPRVESVMPIPVLATSSIPKSIASSSAD